MTKRNKGTSHQDTSRQARSQSSRLIRDFLRGGLTITIGDLPIQVTVGRRAASETPARPSARPASAVSAPKPRRKLRRRKSRKVLAPDPRDIRGYLATQMEGATLTGLAQHFQVKRPLMKRMLARLVEKKEVTLFKGAFFNNKRLRQRRISSKWSEPVVAATSPVDAAPEAFAEEALEVGAPEVVQPEAIAEPVAEPVAEVAETAEVTPAPTAPTAVPDPDPEEHPEPLTYPERNAA